MTGRDRLSPMARPKLQPGPLLAALQRSGADWVLCGSQVLALHGADLEPNDLDVVPDLTPDNLARIAACLEELGAVKAYLDGWGGARGTYKACLAWRADEPSAAHLDWLYVTPFGLLDIVIEFAEPYATIMQDAQKVSLAGHAIWASDPRRVLRALEDRSREKDRARAEVYRRMRRKFGMAETPDRQGMPAGRTPRV